jgi:glycosyltransferase involved in cell wall biosynthesis
MKNLTPKVSVCIICFNHEEFIEEALNNVLNQIIDFKLEVVISDDKSTDETPKIIERIIAEYQGSKTIRYFPQKENLGIIKNFVFALNKCQGQFIAICEGDDYWIDKLKIWDYDKNCVSWFYYLRS